MQHILLLGAGFSRNWGGWLATEAFEYLLGCPEISQNLYLRELLWKNQARGGFEDALSEVQADSKVNPVLHKSNFDDFQCTVRKMFEAMNKGFENIRIFEFTSESEKTIRQFLFKFDAIFTLNQDLLLEHQYIGSTSNDKWIGFELPGMQSSYGVNTNSWGKCEWFPKPETEFDIMDQRQSYFKLHGSSNWLNSEGGSMLIMGGNKAREIGLSPVLKWYHEQFEEHLSHANTRLMVIGYGFRDDHINAIITNAIKNGLKMFIIDPNGAELAMNINKTQARGLVTAPTLLEASFQQSLIGASRRSLREIFGSDMIEHNKVMRFFND